MQPVRVTRRRQRFPSKKRPIIYLILLLALSFLIYSQFIKSDSKSPPSANSASNNSVASSFHKNRFSTDKASSLWVVVNKGRMLPSSYVPSSLAAPNILLRTGAGSPEMQLRPETDIALQKMAAGAKKDGINLMLVSGYRSYQYQVGVYSGYLKTIGQKATDASSARPGHSEHQTGLAADLGTVSRKCELQACFGDTSEGQWLAANAYKYGFIIRYPKGLEKITGYEYEPWHVRFVGSDLAAEIQRSHKTLEQFFGLPTYPDYPADILTLY